jgi:hypothetical protein
VVPEASAKNAKDLHKLVSQSFVVALGTARSPVRWRNDIQLADRTFDSIRASLVRDAKG